MAQDRFYSDSIQQSIHLVTLLDCIHSNLSLQAKVLNTTNWKFLIALGPWQMGISASVSQ